MLGMTLLGGLGSLLWEYGFLPDQATRVLLHRVQLWSVAIFFLVKLTKLVAPGGGSSYLERRWLDFAVLGVLLIQGALYLLIQRTPQYRWLEATGELSALPLLYLSILQVGIVVVAGLRGALFQRLVLRLGGHPARSILIGYLSGISLGAALLRLPGAGHGGVPLSWMEAFFTSTSAICVTGLSVIDIGTRLSPVGQACLLGLIQLGGLGILTVTAVLISLAGSQLPIGERQALEACLDLEGARRIGRAVLLILVTTLTLEAAGALALFYAWQDYLPDPGARLASSLFHSASAFCNAGFSLFPDSLQRFASDPFTNLIIGSLIIAGGLGFAVLGAMGGAIARGSLGLSRSSFDLHARIVLITSGVLVVAGSIAFFALEHTRSLAALPVSARWTASVFQSITLRTAGFETISIAGIGIGTMIVSMLLMAIGGSPGSTAGGMKTTTAAVVFLSIFGRRLLARLAIHPEDRMRAIRLASIFLGCFAGGVAVIWFLEARIAASLVFEVMSALATVGLTMGETVRVNDASRILLMLFMIIGRLGPLTIALSLLARSQGIPRRSNLRFG